VRTLASQPEADIPIVQPRLNEAGGAAMFDPRRRNIFADANALDRPAGDGERARQVERLLALWDANEFNLILPKGVRVELQHPSTPSAVRDLTSGAIFTLPTSLTTEELCVRRAIEAALQGDAKPGKHAADAEHLAEASKYGGVYFITHDTRILRRSGGLRDLLSPALAVVTLAQFLETYDRFTKPLSS